MPKKEVSIDRVVVDKTHRVVFVETSFGRFKGDGVSRCAEGDPFHKEIGVELALARSLKDLARQLERAGRRKVDAQDEARERLRVRTEEKKKAVIEHHEAFDLESWLNVTDLCYDIEETVRKNSKKKFRKKKG